MREVTHGFIFSTTAANFGCKKFLLFQSSNNYFSKSGILFAQNMINSGVKSKS